MTLNEIGVQSGVDSFIVRARHSCPAFWLIFRMSKHKIQVTPKKKRFILGKQSEIIISED